MRNQINRQFIQKAAIFIFWLLVWQLLAKFINKGILFASPIETTKSLMGLAITEEFWRTLVYSASRIGAGFFIALFIGCVLGMIGYVFEWFRNFISPIILLMRTIPVASFIILALVWIGSRNLSVFISFTIVMPVIYGQMLSGLLQTNKELLEMAYVFKMSISKKAIYIYRSSAAPFLISGCQASLGMCWKAGIAAEVIGAADVTIGGQLYMAKIYLDTAELFAWTVVIILLSYLFELVILKGVKYILGR